MRVLIRLRRLTNWTFISSLTGLALLTSQVHSSLVPIDALLTPGFRSTDLGLLAALYAMLGFLGSLPVWNGLLFLVSLHARRRGYCVESTALLAALSSEAIAAALKLLVNRPRPELFPFGIELGSFPSGHVVRITVMAVIIVALWSRRRLGNRYLVVGSAAAFVSLMAISRVAVGAHWPTDVLGGILLGILWGQVLVAFFTEHKATQATTERA